MGRNEIKTSIENLLNVNFGNTFDTFCEGNDVRLSDARKQLALTSSSTIGNSGSTKTLVADAAVQTCSLSASCKFTMPAATAADFTLVLTQTGSFTATFTGVKWPGGVVPTVIPVLVTSTQFVLYQMAQAGTARLHKTRRT
jgi:hypothetical protein